MDVVPVRDGKTFSGPREFVSGWMLDPDKPEVWGRPVGILQLHIGVYFFEASGSRLEKRVKSGVFRAGY